MKYIVGIDEAGRGPLAGPVAVGAVCTPIKQYDNMSRSTSHILSSFGRYESTNFHPLLTSQNRTIRTLFKGARDSKKMSEKKREEIFEKIKKAQGQNLLQYTVVNQSAKVIDTKGISWAIKNCIKKCLEKLKVDPKHTLVLLDGGIKAPVEFIHQKTIIRGDDKELVISLASICAKVTRDTHMRKVAKKYPQYGLEIHKGYGTLRHRKAIKKHGSSSIHRKTFLKNI